MADEVENAEEDDEEAYMTVACEKVPEMAQTDDLEDKQILASRIDPELWALEVERVSSKLRITVGAEGRDWRQHLEQARKHHNNIVQLWPEAKQQLQRVQNDTSNSIERLESREKYLNDVCGGLTQEYKLKKRELQQLQEEYNHKTEAVTRQNNELHRISDQLDEVKTVMEERGSSISDASPVVRMKSAMKQIQDEIRDME
eukprot:evm.model.scf_287.13 EVM.evm.TU.scf_287.13   scf_287:99718-101008(+)